jgi:uncharacterized protein YfdQ (DUF2303 family)
MTLASKDTAWPPIDAIQELADKAGSAIVSVTLQHAPPGLPLEVPALLNRKSGTVASVKEIVEAWRTAPERKTGTADVLTLESFIALVDRHKTGHSVIFADTDWEKPSLTAVIDYHRTETTEADYGQHRIHYEFPLSDSWKAWVKVNTKAMDQTTFAEFIEDHIADLATPDTQEEEDFRRMFGFKVAFPNELVALSKGLQVHSASRVKNSVTLQTGEGEITWEEEHRDAQGNKLQVPGLFILSVPPFFRGKPTRIPVRLRYRLAGGAISWICQLYRPDVAITEEVVRDMERAATETGLPHFEGTPEMSA